MSLLSAIGQRAHRGAHNVQAPNGTGMIKPGLKRA